MICDQCGALIPEEEEEFAGQCETCGQTLCGTCAEEWDENGNCAACSVSCCDTCGAETDDLIECDGCGAMRCSVCRNGVCEICKDNGDDL